MGRGEARVPRRGTFNEIMGSGVPPVEVKGADCTCICIKKIGEAGVSGQRNPMATCLIGMQLAALYTSL